MTRNPNLSKILSAFVFAVLLLFGFRLASQKPVWNDEIYSQIASVENLSYGQILLGEVNEGNATPVFYLSQKIVCDMMQYRVPLEWRVRAKLWDFDRFEDRMVLRIMPVLSISLAIWLIFSYFANFYSLPAAIFSLVLSISTPMFLEHGAEARPYALWIFLTTVQILSFLIVVKGGQDRQRFLALITIVHFLLAFTVILSLPQIALVSLLLWIYGIREKKRYVFLLFLPAMIVLTYYAISPRYPLGLVFTFDQYLRANISRDRFYMAWLFSLGLFFYGVQQKLKMRNFMSAEIMNGLAALGLFCGAIACAVALLVLFQIKQGPVVQFPVSEKYFIFLAPVGVIAVTIFADALIRSLKSKWLQIVFFAGIGGLAVPRMIKVVGQFLKQYPNLFT